MTGYVPYHEAPSVRSAFPESHVSGTDTTEIDHLRQGIEITSDLFRFISTLPKFNTGDAEGSFEIVVYGQSKEFKENVAFEELTRFDPVTHINDPSASMFPIVLNNASLEDPERLGGFIEALAIGSRDLAFLNAESQAHEVRGHIQDGNEDSFKKCDRVTQYLEFGDGSQSRDLYTDAGNTIGTSIMLALPGYFPDAERLVTPFDETIAFNRSVLSASLPMTMSADLRAALIAMTGSSTDEYVRVGFIAMGTGYTFDGNTRGVDSIAFGGLKK